MILLLLILLLRLTEEKRYGRFDLKFVELCARQIARVATTDKIIVEKSTLPVRTAETLQTILDSTGMAFHFDAINPEFLAEGTAIEDLFNADRVLIGGKQTESGESDQTLVDVYAHWLTPNKY
jgi:UDPglucose 6-dehydrogenase